MPWNFLFFKKEFIDSCLNDKKCILHLPEFIFNDNKARLVLDTDPEKRINEVKNFSRLFQIAFAHYLLLIVMWHQSP